jgi:hypothetical protein
MHLISDAARQRGLLSDPWLRGNVGQLQRILTDTIDADQIDWRARAREIGFVPAKDEGP